MTSTKIIKIDPLNIKEAYIKEAANMVAKGGLVVMPTETVYGIAANMSNKATLDRLRAVKKRPQDKHFSLHIDKKERIEDFAIDIPPAAYKLIDKFWPGPLTLILKSKEKDTIGLRMPDNEIALRLISASGVPVVAPSANISGEPAPVNFDQAIKDLDGLVDLAIDAGPVRLGIESTVVDMAFKPLTILREGAISKQDIVAAVAKKIVLFVCTGNSCRSVMAQGLLAKKLKQLGRLDVEVLSAGLMMMGGLGATQETIELLRRDGIDVSSHRSRGVTRDLVRRSDIILAMEELHERRILEIAPEVKNRLFLLKEFAKINDNNLNIPDPIGQSLEFYEVTFGTIKEAVERIVKLI